MGEHIFDRAYTMPKSPRQYGWFLEKVDSRISPLLLQHGFYQPSGKAYEGGEKGIRGAIYARDPGKIISINISKVDEYSNGEKTGFYYWVTVHLPHGYLKIFMQSPLPTKIAPEDVRHTVGWIIREKREELDKVLDEIAQAFDSYLTTNPELKSPWE